MKNVLLMFCVGALVPLLLLAQGPQPMAQGDAPDPGRQRVIASLNGREVTLGEYLDYLIESEGMRHLDAFLNRLLLEREAERLQISIAYQEVDRIVAERFAELTRIYRGDRQHLENALRERHGSPADYRRWLRDQLIWKIVLDRCILASREQEDGAEEVSAEARREYLAGLRKKARIETHPLEKRQEQTRSKSQTAARISAGD